MMPHGIYPKDLADRLIAKAGQPKCTAHSSACNPRCNTLERSEDQIDMF